jgi:hypothetical protein
MDEPLRRWEWVDSLAAALGVRPPWLPPRWAAKLAGSLVEGMARSLRISNRKFKAACAWAPKYPSIREGERVVLTAVEEGEKIGRVASAEQSHPSSLTHETGRAARTPK